MAKKIAPEEQHTTLGFLKEFKKKVEKMESVTTDFSPPTYWYHTGNYALNKILSGSFTRGIPQGRVTILAGPSGAGKSFLSANIIREAQKEGAFIIVIDSENAMDKIFLSRIGVDVSEDKLFYAGVTTVQDVTTVMSDFINGYEAEHGKDNPNAQKVLIVIDSLDMLLTDSESEKFDKGVQTGDQGQRAKLMKHLMRTIVVRITRLNVTVIATHQVYANQDIKNGLGTWIVNNAIRYSASQIALLTNTKLKEDDAVVGIKMRCATYKSRFAQPGLSVQIEVPYEGGMDKYGGLLEPDDGMLGEKDGLGILTKDKLSFVLSLPGKEPLKFSRKSFDDEIWGMVMLHPKVIEGEQRLDADTGVE